MWVCFGAPWLQLSSPKTWKRKTLGRCPKTFGGPPKIVEGHPQQLEGYQKTRGRLPKTTCRLPQTLAKKMGRLPNMIARLHKTLGGAPDQKRSVKQILKVIKHSCANAIAFQHDMTQQDRCRHVTAYWRANTTKDSHWCTMCVDAHKDAVV